MEIVAALKARKGAMEEKLKSKIEELKKLCMEEGGLSGQLPPEYPLSPGEALPAIRRRVGTSFTLPENLLNRAKSSKVNNLKRHPFKSVQILWLNLRRIFIRRNHLLPWNSSTKSSAKSLPPP